MPTSAPVQLAAAAQGNTPRRRSHSASSATPSGTRPSKTIIEYLVANAKARKTASHAA
jgi:hypothetical protein